MIDLVIYPLGRGIYRVECDGRVLLERSDQPLLDGARALHRGGVGPGARVSMRHAGSEHRSLVSTVGGAAKLTVRETQKDGPYFVPYQPYDPSKRLKVAPPSDLAGGRVADSPEAEITHQRGDAHG